MQYAQFHFYFVLLCASIYLYGYLLAWERQSDVFVAAGSKGNSPTTNEDCLVLFAVARGIPSNLEHESYLDIHKRNLMVIDDQVNDAGEDN